MRTSDIHISGLGVFLPDTATIAEAVEGSGYPAANVESHGWTGVAVAGDLPSPEMALRAATNALERGGGQAGELDLLLYADTWHQGPDGWQPQYHLQRNLGCPRALAVEWRHGCNGMFSALEMASSYLRAVPKRKHALATFADNFGTPMIGRCTVGEGLVVGDAATAVTLSTEGGFARLLSVCSVTVPEAEEIHRCGEPLFPPGATVGRHLDYAPRLALYQEREAANTTSAPGFMKVQQQLGACLDRALTEAGVTIADINRVVLMNTSRQQTEERFMKMFGLPLEACGWEFGRTVGHISGSDQLAAFDHLLTTGGLSAGDHLLMFSLGPGITLSFAVVAIDETPPWLASP
ncbi:ketoacyl-ACP synthase III family protein [Actinocrispum wychmicini]|uniref:3-oxoacyl-[acyl-carrier-protein] synthase-3/clorobiocin biosynthesis protein CloN2 n=1 Tax=Actinocrispum wychmicini TaxID=1213861 RepID=A0A4V2S7P6_9PSEU|nr:ketoacyl-ACP synthase III family protein [Actinocrispum wychmicini]TCO60810.1 3-oxoacyl-[acyl-carrier-protein] synthase-3/clorobiocin biosynthesis protein CloN2 [Actinocrispum wychmicini]